MVCGFGSVPGCSAMRGSVVLTARKQNSQQQAQAQQDQTDHDHPDEAVAAPVC